MLSLNSVGSMVIDAENDDSEERHVHANKEDRNEDLMSGRDEPMENTFVNVEICVPSICAVDPAEARNQWKSFLQTGMGVWDGRSLNVERAPEALRRTFQHANLDQSAPLDWEAATLYVHTYSLSNEEVAVEELEPINGDDDCTPVCDNITLPHVTLEGLWENLVFDSSIKKTLLGYAQSALLFADKGVSNHIVGWNRLLLLHGPPGTGKTSLCRALAHKLAIRLGHRFTGTQLLEIQSHSLFSKWFSTSGKLVHRLFELVQEMVEDNPKALVCVLLDEVESLAASRTGLGGGDPADAMRAVNSLLTSLDRLKAFPNVLVLATTNLTSKVDLAFLDRADLRLHIGMPNREARYEILRSCVTELLRVGILANNSDGPISTFADIHQPSNKTVSECLLQCATLSNGLSGRSLRRLPLQCHARNTIPSTMTTLHFLQQLKLTIQVELESMS